MNGQAGFRGIWIFQLQKGITIHTAFTKANHVSYTGFLSRYQPRPDRDWSEAVNKAVKVLINVKSQDRLIYITVVYSHEKMQLMTTAIPALTCCEKKKLK